MNRRLAGALVSYAVLAILAGFTLEGLPRIGTWIFLGAFAIKTILVALRQRLD